MDIPAAFLTSESAELLSLAEEIGRIGIIDWDVRGGSVRLSPKAREMYGLEKFDGRYDTWAAAVYREDVIRVRNVIAEAFEAKTREFELDFRIIRQSDNEMRWLLARRLAFYDEAGMPYRVVGVSIDITDRKRELVELRNFTETLDAAVKHRTHELEARTRELEAENEARRKAEGLLRQAQKMEAVGQLTGGVAHDFNNLLTIMQGGLEMIGRQVPILDASPAASRIVRGKDMALEAVRRATRLTERLLAFARQQPLEPKAIDANRLVGGVCELLRRMVGETIALETVLSAGLWITQADVNQLENAILNLVLNARDAMPKGGKVTIETTNAHLDDAYVGKLAEPVKAGQYVMISVRTPARAWMPIRKNGHSNRSLPPKELARGTVWALAKFMASCANRRATLQSIARWAKVRPSRFICPAIMARRTWRRSPEVDERSPISRRRNHSRG